MAKLLDEGPLTREARCRNLKPSRADEALTQTLKAALALVEVRVLGPRVVAGPNILAFAEKGLL